MESEWTAPPLPWEIWERVASFCDARTLARFAQTSTGCRDVARRLNARARFVTAYSTLDDIDAAVSDVTKRGLTRGGRGLGQERGRGLTRGGGG